MALPVGRIYVCVADRISAVDHGSVTAVNPHMAHRPRRIVSTREKDNIPGFRICRRNRSALVIDALCGSPWQVMYPAVGKHPADKTGTVKAGGRA